MDTQGQRPSGWQLLGRPEFAAFVMARLAAVLAMQIQAVVVAWDVYARTGEPLALAWVGLAQFVPMLILLLPAGDLIDRYSRRMILQWSWRVQALCALALLVLAWRQGAVQWVYAVLVLFGAARAFMAPALSSLLPQLVPRRELPAAMAANSVIMKFATIAGPLLGGGLFAVSAELAYGVCLVAFLFSLLMLWQVTVRHAEPPAPVEGTAFSRFTAGIHYIRTRSVILGAISLDLFAVLLGGVVALLPVYAADVLHVGPVGLGALRSALAAGALLTGLYLTLRPVERQVGRVMFVAVMVFGLANLVFSLSHWFWLSLLMMLVAGAADMFSVYVRMTLIQLATPDAMRGRVNAVNMLFIGSSNELGEVRAGAMAEGVGAVPSAVLGSLATLGVAGLWIRQFPSLWRVDRFSEVDVSSTGKADAS